MMRKHLCFVVGLAAVVGCQDTEVRTRRVSKPERPAARTLAVIVPKADAVWFFKLSGPANAVAADEAKFRAFVGSAEFTADPPVKYSAPDGWRVDAGGGRSRGGIAVSRFATLRTANGNEAIITRLGPESGDVLPNVNRWRGEIGLGPIAPADLPRVAKSIEVGSAAATWVDLQAADTDPAPAIADPHLGVIPPAAPAPGAPPSAKGLKFDSPSGWRALPASGMRAAAFRIGEGDESAEVTLIPLSGPSGDETSNINRWRTELRLDELPADKLKPTIQQLPIEGKPSAYVNLLGPENAKRQQTLAVIVPRGQVTWFIKMRGSAKVVGAEREKFEAFARSLQLPAGDR